MIVGLGNPGKKYEHTKHNIGFLFADYFAARHGMKMKKDGEAQIARAEIKGEKILLIKPETFMNLSGQAVQPAAAFNKIKTENILVVHDDVDLPLLDVRIKKGGGEGGHNGLKSITEHMSGSGYIRVRVGVGRPENPEMETSDWVLSKIPAENMKELDAKFEIMEKFVLDWIELGYDKAASRFGKT